MNKELVKKYKEHKTKPEESQFKVDDWIIIDGEICKIIEDNDATCKVKMYKPLEKSHPDYLIQDVFKECIKHWKPQPKEWCLFWSKGDTHRVLARYHSESNQKYYTIDLLDEISFDYCEPFIGSLN